MGRFFTQLQVNDKVDDVTIKRNASQALSIINGGVLYSPDSANGNLYIEERQYQVNNATNRYSFLKVRGSSTIGLQITFKKRTNIWPIYSIEKGEMRPAWYPSFTPDTSSGLVYNANASSNMRYYEYLAGSGYAEWIAPSGVTNHNKMIVYYVGLSSGGEGTIKVNGTTVGTFDTYNASVDYTLSTVVNLSSNINAGDTVRIENDDTSSIRVCAIVTYSTTEIVDGNSPGRIVLEPLTAITSATSSIELAWSVAPAGSSKKWIGGYAHNELPTYCEQVSPSESITNGLSQGYNKGYLTWTRSSTVRYDSTPTDIATMDEQYLLMGDCLSYFCTFTPSVSIDTSNRYVAMLPLSDTSTRWICNNCYGIDVSSLASNETIYLPICTTLGTGYVADIFVNMLQRSENIVKSHMIWNSGYHKAYWDIGSISGWSSGGVTFGWDIWANI